MGLTRFPAHDSRAAYPDRPNRWFLVEAACGACASVHDSSLIAGLLFYFRRPEGERYRVLGWTFVSALVLFAVAQAREYYTAPLYPMLLAAGAISADRWPRWARGLNWAGLALALGLGIAFALPVAPMNSRWFDAAMRVNENLREEIGWHELVDTVAGIRDSLPAAERATAGILTGNYGEAGAIDL